MPDIREITDLSAPELDIYARLSEGQLLHYYEPDTGLFIAESPKVISRALDAGYEPVSLLMEPEHVEGEAREVVSRCGGIPVYTAEARILTELTGFQLTRGVLCAMRRRRLPDAASLCAGARRVAVLENVMNPTNVGAIFRSAAALSMDAVLLTKDCSNPLYRRAARVSMRLAVVLGTEGDGLAAETIADCDYTVMIPMAHGVDSLNVAAASAVAFWELGKR